MAETPREVAAATIADAMSRPHLAERARLLSRLVAGVGVLALAVVSGGAFARYAAVARQSDFVVTLEDAARATRTQVYEQRLGLASSGLPQSTGQGYELLDGVAIDWQRVLAQLSPGSG